MNKKQADKQEAIDGLRDQLKPGDTVFTVLRHTSASGMSRSIDLVIVRENQPCQITYRAARALGYSIDEKHGGMRATGCGMDMGFHLVYNLAYCLFPDGFGVEGDFPNGSKGRAETKEMAEKAVAIGAKFRGRNGDATGWDKDGGYALNHRWI